MVTQATKGTLAASPPHTYLRDDKDEKEILRNHVGCLTLGVFSPPKPSWMCAHSWIHTHPQYRNSHSTVQIFYFHIFTLLQRGLAQLLE